MASKLRYIQDICINPLSSHAFYESLFLFLMQLREIRGNFCFVAYNLSINPFIMYNRGEGYSQCQRNHEAEVLVMIKIYSKQELLTKTVVASHAEVFFARNIAYTDLTPLDFQIIENIDKAVPIPIKEGYFDTPFGLAQVKHLSTGCKTVLNAIHFPDKIFSFIECGGNAISELVRVSSQLDFDIEIYLPRYRNIEPMANPIIFNGNNIQTSDDFNDAWRAMEEDYDDAE